MTPKATTPNGAFNISTHALLMRVIIGRAGAKAKSKTLQREAAATHQGDLESFDTKVGLLARAALDPIVQLESKTRAAFYFGTVRWDDNAWRLVPASRYPALLAELHEFRDMYTDAVEALVAQCEDLAKDYRRRVGAVLARETPFPSASELRANYRFEIRQMPVADPNDLRLRMVSNEVVDEIKASVAASYDERLQQAQGELIERLRERVGALRDALSRETTSDRKKIKGKLVTVTRTPRLHDALAENLDKELEALPHLNITGNPEIARLIQRAKDELGGIDLAEMKSDPKLRQATVKIASSVLDDLKDFGL